MPAPFHEFVRLWFACRAGMGGIAHWPDAGGVAHQAAWIVEAFGLLAGFEAKFDKHEKETRGGG